LSITMYQKNIRGAILVHPVVVLTKGDLRVEN
jgi:hypothetical protein